MGARYRVKWGTAAPAFSCRTAAALGIRKRSNEKEEMYPLIKQETGKEEVAEEYKVKKA